jgi:hypothetical protein
MRLRMADEDRATYGAPDELDFAAVPAWLDSLGYDDLVAVEDQLTADLGPAYPGEDVTLLWVLDQLISHTRASSRLRMVRVRLWLALRAAGADVALADFRPAHLYGVRVIRPEADAVPPDGSGSSPTSSPESAEPTTTSTSESSTDGSTPGPGAPTE